jgi:hypothetical protein
MVNKQREARTMNTRTKQEIKLKSGRIIPANSYACIECGAWDIAVYVDGKGFRIPQDVANGETEGSCRDWNGNKVGGWKITKGGN